MSETNICRWITGTVWAAGAGLLYLLWHMHLKPELLDVLFGFVLYVATFFYVFALIPIHWFVERRLSTRA